jgi:hypothetical protein
MKNKNLKQLSETWGSDKHVHGFTEFYEKYFSKCKSAKNICEIGLGGIMWQQGGKLPGASSRIWLEYFPDAKVFIMDNFSEIKKEEIEIINLLKEENIERLLIVEGDQSNRLDLSKFSNCISGDIDILIDDGGHSMQQQQVSLGYMFKFIKPGGYYVVEDLHTSILPSRPRFGLLPDESNSTLKMIQNFIKSKTINSVYMTREESDYLENEIEYCELFKSKNSITSIIKKR